MTRTFIAKGMEIVQQDMQQILLRGKGDGSFADTVNKEISLLFDHLLENNKYGKELRNLIIYKRALFDSNFVIESELLLSLIHI